MAKVDLVMVGAEAVLEDGGYVHPMLPTYPFNYQES